MSADPPLPLLAGETGVRLSLAGAQNKVPVYVEGNSIFKTTGSLATSHILKPPIRAAIDLLHTVENETFNMQLAGKLVLNVPSAEVRTVRNLNFYLVERLKNLALLYDETGSVRLAPFYDLLCTAVYPELDQRMAMRLGGERWPDRLRRKHWERFAEELGISPRVVFGELENLTQTIEQTAEALAREFNDRYGCVETMNGILEIIRRRCGRAWAFLRGETRVRTRAI